MNRIRTSALALTTGIVVLAAVSGNVEGASASTSSAHVSQAVKSLSKGTITIRNYGFSGPGTLAPGARVTIKNLDSTAHTVTANSGHAFNVRVGAHKTVTFTAPRKAGKYAFHCRIHPDMTGVLRIK